MIEPEKKEAPPLKVSRKILIVGGPKLDLDRGLLPHKILRARSLEASFEVLSESRPDLIVHFVQRPGDLLEEAVLTWLIGGFRGNLVVFDPQNKIEDFHALLKGNMIDAYVSGPVSPERFLTIIKSHLNPASRGGVSRTYALFDLFRHLFERGMDAIFFFSEDLSRCVAANKQAERLTGRTLFELRHTRLSDLCGKGQFGVVDKMIQKARHSYYDSHGHTVLTDRLGRPMEANISTGVFHFGRAAFVKFEIQKSESLSQTPSMRPKDRLSYRRRENDRVMSDEPPLARGVSMLVCRVHFQNHREDEDRILEEFSRKIRATIRKTDSLARLGHAQFAILLPKSTPENIDLARKRIQAALSQNTPKGCQFDFETAHCPPEAYPFLQLLENAAREAPEPKRAIA